MSCPHGLYFNPDINTCDHIFSVVCAGPRGTKVLVDLTLPMLRQKDAEIFDNLLNLAMLVFIG